jgi:D-alanyl-D-alanine carboxypeptidase (penicillin-binding protein 5/6)
MIRPSTALLGAVCVALVVALPVRAQVPAPVAVPVPVAAPSAVQPVPPAPTLSARSWVLMDQVTGQVLASRDPELRVEPASITKVMTSYVVSAELALGKIKLDDAVMISEHAWRGGGAGTDGSTSFLPVNQTVPLKDLLYGMVIQSGNDASIALAEHVGGSEPVFAQLMNEYAGKIGLAGTHYVNAHGLSAPEHYTTALDVARLSLALIRDHPEDYRLYAIKEFTFNGITQHNRNTLLWRDPTVDGIKTGHHSGAGYCLAVSALRGEMRLIAVVMGASSEKVRADEAQALLNYGFRFYETHALYAAGAAVANPELWKGESPNASLGVASDARITIPRGAYARLQASINVPKPLLAPLAKGAVVGNLAVALDGKPLIEVPLVALADYPEGGFFKRLGDGIWLWWSSD